MAETISPAASRKSGGRSLSEVGAMARTPRTLSARRARIPLPVLTVTMRWHWRPGSPNSVPISTTGIGEPRMTHRPRTNCGAWAIFSMGSGRIVSTTFSRGNAHNRRPARHSSQKCGTLSEPPIATVCHTPRNGGYEGRDTRRQPEPFGLWEDIVRAHPLERFFKAYHMCKCVSPRSTSSGVSC